MTYCAIMSSFGFTMLFCGILDDSVLLIIVGLAMFIACGVMAQILEDKLTNRIEKLEKELKGLKDREAR